MNRGRAAGQVLPTATMLCGHAERVEARKDDGQPASVRPAADQAVKPPSIVKLAPVTKPDSALARYATIPAISSGEL